MNQDLFQNLESEIHVWWSILDQPQYIVNKYQKMLSQEEQERINKFKFQLLRGRQIVSRGLLRRFISKYISIDPKEVEFTYNKYGKPLLNTKQNKVNLQFNISHSENLGIFAFAIKNSVGVDVEEVRELLNLEGMVELFMSQFEQRWFSEVAPVKRNEVFYNLWTVKEAFIKAIGTGFSFPLVNVEVKINGDNKCEFHQIKGESGLSGKWKVFTFAPVPNYTTSLVTEASDFEIKRFYWEPMFENGKQTCTASAG
jgi:4'-phosphopantetheinyl transferase